jgi:uncharacterized membrane protein
MWIMASPHVPGARVVRDHGRRTRHDGGEHATGGNPFGPHGDVLHADTHRDVARDDEETTSMAEHGRGAVGRHAVPGEARVGTAATVGATPSESGPAASGSPVGSAPGAADPTAPFASAPPRPGRTTGGAGPRTVGGTHRGTAGRAPDDGLDAPGPDAPGLDAAGPDAPDLEDTDLEDTDLDDEAEDDLAPVRGTGWVLLVGGLVGAVVALVLLVEKLDLLANPDYIPSCSIDPVLSCGTIMKTAQAAVLGFPNPVIGLLTFPVVAACGAIVVSRAELPRWVWWALEIGSFAGVLFIHWLIVQSLVVIHALCPYCMVAWVAVLAIFWFTTMHNLREGNLGGAPAGDTLVRRHGWGLAAWYLLIVVAIVASFPAYFAAMVGLG